MYRIDKNTDLGFLFKQQLIQLVIGEFAIEFRFTDDIAMLVESEFRHYSERDELLTKGTLPSSATSLVKLVSEHVVASEVIDDWTLQLTFSNGHRVCLVDVNDDAESIRIVGRDIDITI